MIYFLVFPHFLYILQTFNEKYLFLINMFIIYSAIAIANIVAAKPRNILNAGITVSKRVTTNGFNEII